MSDGEKTIEEKIDFIYTTLKKEEKRRKIGLYGKIFFNIVILVFLFFYVPYYIQLQTQRIKNLIPTMDNPQVSDALQNWLDILKDTFSNFDFK